MGPLLAELARQRAAFNDSAERREAFELITKKLCPELPDTVQLEHFMARVITLQAEQELRIARLENCAHGHVSDAVG